MTEGEAKLDREFDGKVAIVTGGTKGLGHSISLGLADRGARVAVWSRSGVHGDAVRATGWDAGRAERAEAALTSIKCDTSMQSEVEAAMAETVDRLGRVDILVASAGVSIAEGLLDVSPETLQQVLSVNVAGVLWSLQAAAEVMIRQGHGGKLIVISSVRAQQATAKVPAYAASKSGAEAIVRSAALDLAPHNIQVNAVRPGLIVTEMTEHLWADAEVSSRLIDRVPAGRWGRPEDIVGVVLYLASAAANYHTGDVLTVDGGLTAG